jgi:hypothetical protein
MEFRPSHEIVELESYAVIRSINSIKSGEGTFKASIEVWSWLWLSEQEYLARKSNVEAWRPDTAPRPAPYNGIDSTVEPIVGANGLNHHVRQTKDGKCKALIGWQVDATFGCAMDLHNFPMDSHELVIDIMFNTYNDCETTKSTFNMNWVDPRFGKFVQFQEPTWELLRSSIKRQPHSDTRHYEIRMFISRIPAYYFVHVIPMQALTSALAMAVFVFGDDSFVDRFNALVAVIFATVALLFLIQGELPRLPYLTMLDKYTYGTFCNYFAIGVLCLVQTFEDYTGYDFEFLCTSAALFTVLHIWLAVAQRTRQTASNKWLKSKLADGTVTTRQETGQTFAERNSKDQHKNVPAAVTTPLSNTTAKSEI